MNKVLLILGLFFSSCIGFADEYNTTIQAQLQAKVKKMLNKVQNNIGAKEIIITIMNSKTGDILSLASSSKLSESMAVEYLYEPGSVIKPITLALLFDKGLVNPHDVVDGHNGRYKIGAKVIVDKHKFDFISAEDVIIYSSNIGIVQLAQKLSGIEFHNGLRKFGFSQDSIPSPKKLNKEIYKATCSYGYGMKSNLIQLVRAYNVFNNNGKSFLPKTTHIIKSSTAKKMKNILIKTVNQGTAKSAMKAGLIIGGKTGTAHIVEKGRYVKKYNTSFIGFANDLKNNKYTIGVLVIQPKNSNLSSQTAVPIFKKVVDIMLKNEYLIANE